ncbi:hypothetical protein ACJJTC_012220 [Scirpophaga incertulas]
MLGTQNRTMHVNFFLSPDPKPERTPAQIPKYTWSETAPGVLGALIDRGPDCQQCRRIHSQRSPIGVAPSLKQSMIEFCEWHETKIFLCTAWVGRKSGSVKRLIDFQLTSGDLSIAIDITIDMISAPY